MDGKSYGQLADQFKIDRTQVGSILERKADLMDAFEDNANGGRKRMCVRAGHNDVVSAGPRAEHTCQWPNDPATSP